MKISSILKNTKNKIILKDLYNGFVNNITQHFANLLIEYTKVGANDNLLYSIQNSLIFVLLVLINLDDEKYKTIFELQNKIFLKTMGKIIELFFEKDKEKFLALLVSNFCFGEYKLKALDIGENFFIDIFEEIGTKLGECPDLILNLFEINKITDKLVNFQIDFQKIQKMNVAKNANFGRMVCQSLIIILFSANNLEQNKLDKTYKPINICKFFEDLISKHISSTKSSIDANISSLFRKDDFSNYFIKSVFFLFGGDYYIQAFFIPLKKCLISFEKEVKKEEFESFFEEVLKKVYKILPIQLQIILYLTQIKVDKEYESKNLSPIFTILFFNYLTSPKTQEYFDMGCNKYKSMKNINRLIRNICFNTIFDSKDPLYEYNDTIYKFYIKLCDLYYEQIEQNISKMSVEEINSKFDCMLINQDFFVPTFSVCFSWTILASAFNLTKKNYLKLYKDS